MLRFTKRDRANIRTAADPRRLLPGENPDTDRLEEIEHWIAHYSELAAFNQQLVDRLASRLESPDLTSEESTALDLPLAQAHAFRIALRRYYWLSRARRVRQVSKRTQPSGEVKLSELS